jgi:thiamine-phosphate pyrophosphorylase
VLCLVTDRRRLRPDAGTFDAAKRALIDQASWAAGVGIDLLQVREPDLETAPLEDLVAAMVDAVAGSDTRVVVNDRTDVALACRAHGVHLRHDSVPSEAARRLVPPGFLVGRSVHSTAQARAAGPVDYLIAGTVFASRSKGGNAPLLGVDGLAEIVQVVSVPVLAIGGITRGRLDEIAAAGAAGAAGIGLFIDWFDRLETPS